MLIANFSVSIPEGSEQDTGHVIMRHGAQYTIRLQNHLPVRCNADIRIDGESIGVLRMTPGQLVDLERPFDDTGRFTFFRASSDESAKIGGARNADSGVVQVEFVPEKQRPQVFRSASLQGLRGDGPILTGGSTVEAAPKGMAPANVEAGITGLTGVSSQKFQGVAPMDIDLSGVVTITLRLVADTTDLRPLHASPRANPVPAAV